MFSYTGRSTIQMAKQYRAEESTGAQQKARAPKKLRSPRLAPPSVLSSRWWVAAEGLRTGLHGQQRGMPTTA